MGLVHLLCRDLQIGDGDGWVVILDQQKEILKVVQTWLRNAEHRNCASIYMPIGGRNSRRRNTRRCSENVLRLLVSLFST
jgi:hypothetical protein